MITIYNAQRVLKVTKGLVTLSNSLCTGGQISNTKLGMAVTMTAVAGAATYHYLMPWMLAENAKLSEVLEGGGFNPEEATDQLVDTVVPEVMEVFEIGNIPLTPELEQIREKEPVKRRIRKGCRGKFVREIVAAVKLRLGTPRLTLANRRAVQRVAREEISEYNLRKVVAASIMPTIVEAVFVPNKWEVEAAQLGSCALAQTRKLRLSMLLEVAGFNQA